MAHETHVLMVVTSHDRIDEETPTGLWLEEFAVPYRTFVEQAYRVTVASPRGGIAPIDPRSDANEAEREAFAEPLARLRATDRVEDLDPAGYDALFLPGGHGTMFDFPDHRQLRELIEAFARDGRPIAAVCHGPSALVGARRPDGAPLVAGRRITSFTDAEEREVGLDAKVPFLLESRLRELGADFVAAPNWMDHVQEHGRLITGQNPQSSASAARALVHTIQSLKVASTFARP